MPDKIGVGMIGYKFMGKAHSNAFRQAGHYFDLDLVPDMRVVCGRDAAGVSQAADQLGWREHATSWREVIARDDIGLVDITTGNDTHCEIALAAAAAKKHILCEKPLAMTVAEARQMLDAAEKAGVRHMVNFNYRKVPAVQFARKLIQEGAVGKIYHWRAVYLQDWIVDPNFPLVWRLKKELAGSGAHGDINAHIIDLSRFLVGEIAEVSGLMTTFIKQRPEPTSMTGISATAGEKMGEVTVDDAAAFIARFENGAIGAFEASRFATGHKNFNSFEVNGSEGSLIFNLERLNELQYFSRRDPTDRQGFRTIMVTESEHPFLQGWWPPGHTIGWEHSFTHQVVDLMNAIAHSKPASPTFEDGLRCQQVLEAVEQSAVNRTWMKPAEMR
ncbi:MAG TPA: Gfo/Idh/MocA family oxidoreductase [Armatimonadota bacterium]|nr:Gfo/Idh/MocA family oxidoreductase [Armatimonadota bacterium]